MKKIIQLLALVAVVALPAFTATAYAQDQCTPENKLAWYNEFRQHFKGDTAKANDLAKKWLACPVAAGEEPQANYLKNFVTLYEKQNRKDRIVDLVYVKKDYAKGIELGKQVLTDEPDNLKVLIDTAYAGYAANNPSFAPDAISQAQKAIQMIEGGKTLDNWTPYLTRDDALGYLYFAVGSLTKDSSAALKVFLKAAQFDGRIKKQSSTYLAIAKAYEFGPYAALASDYEAKYKGKDETPESKLALENINQIVDRLIDAYARAVALAGPDATDQANKKLWLESLATWYKYRNKSDAGMTELIAGILSKPLPPEPTPITALPASATGAAEGTMTTGTAAPTGVTTAAGATTKPVATPGNGAAKPATTTAPASANSATTKPATAAKPKPKRNHRNH